MNNYISISIGFQCTTAEILKKKNQRTSSFPFDWILSNPKGIFNLLTKLTLSSVLPVFKTPL